MQEAKKGLHPLAALVWRKSSASGSGNCVEVALSDIVYVRDSKNPAGGATGFHAQSWMEFMGAVRLKSFEMDVNRPPRR